MFESEMLNNDVLKKHYIGVVKDIRSRIKDFVLERDDIKYVQNPDIEAEYMSKIGCYEIELAEAEIAQRRAKKKLGMCKNCVLTESEIDENIIDAVLDDEFDKWVSQEEVLGTNTTNVTSLTSKQFGASEFDPEKIKKLWRNLCKKLHPDLNQDLTDSQKRAFTCAQIAYDSLDYVSLVAYCDVYNIDTNDRFEILSESEIAQTIEDLKAQEATQLEILRKLKESFPFCMKQRMKDKNWVEQTVLSLKNRIKKSETSCARFEAQINSILQNSKRR